MAKKSYYGIDVNKAISLYEYGLLVRKTNKNEYDVIYGVDNDGMTYTSFNTSIKSNEEIKEIINESWFDKNGFFSYIGTDENKWFESDIASKLYDLISYYGTDNVFSTGYGIYNMNQIAFKTKIAAPR